MWKNPSPLYQTWGLVTQAFCCHRASWLLLFITLRFLPAILGEGKAYANVRCCCPLIPGERSVNNMISSNSLVNSVLHSETSQTPRSTACKHACGKNYLWLSFSIRNGGSNSLCSTASTLTYVSESSKSCAINACFSLKPKHFIPALLLSKLARIFIPGTSRHIFKAILYLAKPRSL